MKPLAYDNSFFDDVEEGSVRSARAVVPLLAESLQIGSVVDVGCGRGAWLRVFQEHGVRHVRGLDGDYVDRERLLIDRSCFTAVDLGRPFEVEGTFDLCVCLEVAEHLPPSVSTPLVQTLTKAAPLVLFSAAIPGQVGVNHVNARWPHEWRTLFEAHGFEKLDPVRRCIWADANVDWWYRQNIVLYARSTFVDGSEVLRRERALVKAGDFELINAKLLRRYVRQHSSTKRMVITMLRNAWQRF